jgi:hypothetical protein
MLRARAAPSTLSKRLPWTTKRAPYFSNAPPVQRHIFFVGFRVGYVHPSDPVVSLCHAPSPPQGVSGIFVCLLPCFARPLHEAARESSSDANIGQSAMNLRHRLAFSVPVNRMRIIRVYIRISARTPQFHECQVDHCFRCVNAKDGPVVRPSPDHRFSGRDRTLKSVLTYPVREFGDASRNRCRSQGVEIGCSKNNER